MRYLLLAVLVACIIGFLIIPTVFAQDSEIPAWIKNNAGWWATNQINDSSFLQGIQFLIKEGIMVMPSTETSEASNSQEIPAWIKNSAGWWAEDKISEGEFVNAITYLIKVGIIIIESSKSPELIAEMWVNGDIDDEEFLANVEQLIEKDIITIQNDSVIKTSQLPDWLVNNAGWWAARIITDSDFNFDPGYIGKKTYPCDDNIYASNCIQKTYNSHGFRGDEFEKEKLDNTFRIFAIGGSTTEGGTADDDKTWPAHLQQIIDEKTTGKKIEIINAGISGAGSEQEYNMIKNKISSLDPDLIIMYDGWNDKDTLIEKTIQNWKSVCELGNDIGFDTIIIVQPLPITGQRVTTEQELVNSFSNLTYLQKSQQYVDSFEKLGNICTKTADFRGIFDYVLEPIYWDAGHTMSFGNKIIAENTFSIISPIYFGKTYPVIQSDLQKDNDEPITSVVYAVGADLSGKNFDDLNLQNAVFDKADLSNTSFKNANIDGARFVFANLDNSNLLNRTDLHNVNLAGVDLSNTSLKGKDLSGANLSYVDLSEHDLTGTNLSDTILVVTDLSGRDLTDIQLTNADFRYANLSGSKLPDSQLINNNFDYAILKDIDLSGKYLSGSSFIQVNLEGSDMQNTNLSDAAFVEVDFTKIKNKSLAGADLSETSFAYSNLSGVSLDGITLHTTNFLHADLSGMDFTITNVITDGITFIHANLSNSNFEGIDLSPKQQYFQVFENKAHLNNLDAFSLAKNLISAEHHILIISTEVRGNDLAVNYIFFNNFTHANLENANFKNAKLWNVDFSSANLANANLSGADLRDTNLEGVILDNAILTGANLNCKNHPICESN